MKPTKSSLFSLAKNLLLLGAFFILGSSQLAVANDVTYTAATTTTLIVSSTDDVNAYRATNGNSNFSIDDGVVLTVSVSSTGLNGGIFRTDADGNYSLIIGPSSGAMANSGSVIIDANNNGASGAAAMMLISGLNYVNLTNVTIQNSYKTDHNRASEGAGSAIMIGNANSVNLVADLNFTNVNFLNNRAYRSNTSGVWQLGGAIGNVQAGGNVTIQMVGGSFNGNYASGTAGTSVAFAGGGAVFAGATNGVGASSVSLMDFRDVIFSSNTAMLTSTGNSANVRGGAIAMMGPANARMVLNDVTFENNAAIAMSAAGGSSASAWGGAIFLSTVALSGTNVTFSENYVESTPNSGVANSYGGALYLATNVTGTLSNVHFLGNAANGVGTASQIGGGAVTLNQATSVVTFVDADFTDNTSVGQGGAILMQNGTLTLDATKDITSSGNQASSAATGGFAYLSNAAAVLNINAADGKTYTIGDASNVNADSVVGTAGTININSDGASAGAVVLHADSSANAAAINVVAGALLLGNNNAKLNGAITVGAASTNAAIGGLGTITPAGGTLAIPAGSTLQVGYGATQGTLNITGALSLDAGTFLKYLAYGAGNSSLLNVSGAITLGGPSILDINTSDAGTYQILTAGDLTGFIYSQLGVTSLGSTLAADQYSFSVTGNSLFLTLSSGATFTGSTLIVIDNTNAATANRITTGGAHEFDIDDNVELTFKNEGQFNANGTIVNAGNSTFSFIVKPVGTAGNGRVVFDGGASFDHPSFNATGLNGGAIYINSAGQTVDITNGTFKNFWGTGTAAGVIRAQTSTAGTALTFTNVTFTDNGIVREGAAADGGVLWSNSAGASGVFNTVAFTSNTIVLTNSAGTALGRGGVGFFNSGATLDMTDAVFTNNTVDVHASANATARGGAIFQTGGAGLTVMIGGTYSGNSAVAASDTGTAFAYGGAFYQDRGNIDFTGVLFDNNTALTDGGAYVSALDSTNAGISGSLNNVIFSNNRAGRGGAFALVYSGHTTAESDILFTGGAFTGNQAGNVGAVTDAPGLGGAMFLNHAASDASIGVTINDVSFTDNTAKGTSGMGGAIYIDNPVPVNLAITSTGASQAYTGNIAYGAGDTAVAANGGFAYVANTSVLNISVADGKTLTIGASANTAADTIGGDATAVINKLDSGALVLNADSSAYQGSTYIYGGALTLGNPNAALGGNIVVGAAAVLNGGAGKLTSAATDTLSLLANSTLNIGPASATPSILSIPGSLFLGAGSTVNFNIFSLTSADLITVGGSLLQDTGASTINISQILTSGSIALFDVTGGITGFSSGLLNLTVLGAPSTDGYFSYDSVTAALYLVFGAPPVVTDNNVITWTGANGGSWKGANWITLGTGTNFTQNDIVNLDSANAANNTIDVDTASNATVAGMYVSGTGNYTITGNGIIGDAAASSLSGSAAATAQLVLGKNADDADHVTIVAYTGTLTLKNAANNFKGGIDIDSGALVGDALSLGAGTLGIADNGSLTFDQDAAGAYDAPISGTGSLAKTGAGALTLTADSSGFTGATAIAAGALNLSGAKLGGSVNMTAGSALAGSGSIAGTVTGTAVTITVHDTSAVASTPQILAIGGALNLGAGSTLNYNLYTGNQSDQLFVGSLALDGTSTVNVNQTSSGTYELIISTAALAASDTAGFLTTLNGNALSERTAASYSIVGNALYLGLLNSNMAGVWDGTNGAIWQSGQTNWKTSEIFLNGDSVIFNDSALGTHAVSIDAGGVQVVDMAVNTTTSYTFTGGAITASSTAANSTLAGGTGRLTIGGSGLVVLNNGTNNFAGGIVINTGTLQGDAATLGAPSIANNSALVFDQSANATYSGALTGNGSLTKINTGALTLDNAANQYSGGINVIAGALTLLNSGTATQGAIDIAAAAALNITGEPAYTVQNALTGAGLMNIALSAPTGTVAFTSAAVGATAFTGTVALGASTFVLADANTAALTHATLALDAGNNTTIGVGTQTIGGLAMNGGKLVFSVTVPPEAAADGIISTANLALNSGTVQITLPESGAAPTIGESLFAQASGTTLAHLITASSVSGNATNLTLVDQNNAAVGPSTAEPEPIVQGGVTVASGTYNYHLTSIGGLDVAYALTGLTIASGQTLTLATATGDTGTFAATISGNGNLDIDASVAPVTLTGANNYTGTTTIASGAVTAGVNNALGNTSALNIASAATLNLGAATQTVGSLATAAGSTLNLGTGALTVTNGGDIAGTLAGSGALNVNGGNLAVDAANSSFTGATAIATGATATLGNAAALGSGAINDQGTLTLANTAAGTLANAISGNGVLNLNGAGATTIATANAGFTGQANVNGPVTAANTAALGTGAVNVGSTGALTYTVPGNIDNNFSGAGTLNLAGTGGATTLGGNNTVANINAQAGSNIVAATANSLGGASTNLGINNAIVTLTQNNTALGHVNMIGASTLGFAKGAAGNTATLASLASTGADNILALNTNVGAGVGDTLNITAPASGAYNIAIANTGNAPTSGTTSLTLVKNPGGAATYLGSGTLTFNNTTAAYAYDVNSANGGATLDVARGGVGPAGAAIVGAAAAMPLTWFAELDTIEKRLGDLHLGTRNAPGANLWLRAYDQRLNVNDKNTLVPFHEDQYGSEVGADYGGRQAGYTTYMGGFLGYGGVSRTVENLPADNSAKGSATSFDAGLYLTYVNDNGWYVDAVGKYNHFKSKISATADNGSMNANYSNNAVGISVEGGQRIELRNNWYVTPNAQLAVTNISGANYATDTDIQVNQDTIRTMQLRAGALLGYKHVVKNGQIVQPYVKAYLANQWVSGGQVTVANDPDSPYDPQIKGARIDAGVGVNWVVTKGLQIYFDYEFAKAKDYTKPYGLTLGASYAW